MYIGVSNIASLKDIAREANVSVTTVSLVLNGRAEELRIKEETQKKVMDAVKKLSYRPNLAARKLREENPQRSPVIILFWNANSSGLIIERQLRGIQDYLDSKKDEFDLVIHPYKNDELYKSEYIFKSNSMYDGVLVTGGSEADHKFIHSIEIKVPIVILGRESDRYCFFTSDEYNAGFQVAELFHNRGHKSAGLVVADIKGIYGDDRRNGFLQGCKKYGISLEPENIITCKYAIQKGVNAVENIINNGKMPTAIFFTPEILAISGLKIFHDNGISIPSNVEIVSYGDTAMANYTIPTLTAIRSPMEEMTRDGVELLMDIIHKRVDVPIHRYYETSLVVRESCGGFIR